MAEPLTSPRDLLAARLRQMLWIELTLAEDVLPELLAGSRTTSLRFGFERHLVETDRRPTLPVDSARALATAMLRRWSGLDPANLALIGAAQRVVIVSGRVDRTFTFE